MGDWWTEEKFSVGGGEDVSHRDLALQSMTAGQSTQAILLRKEAERARQLERANKRKQAMIEGQVVRLNEMYGIGESEAALANRAKLEKAQQDLEASTVQVGERRINEGFAAEDRGRRMSLAERGLSGGSIDASSQIRALQTRAEQRQAVVLAGQQAKAGLIDALRARRLQAESALRSGGQVGLDALTLAQQQAYQIHQARGNVIPDNIGAGFSTAGQLYLYSQQAKAAQGSPYNANDGSGSTLNASQPQRVNTNRTQSRN